MDVSVIYPHQLFRPDNHPALVPGRPVFVVEEPLFLACNPIHRQRLLLHRLSMQAYVTELTRAGYTVTYLALPHSTDAVFAELAAAGATTLHIVDTTDQYLEQAIATAGKTYGFARHFYDSSLFLLSRSSASTRYLQSKRFMATFYKHVRQDTGILMDEDGSPTGGKWSYDTENRQKIPKGAAIPSDPVWLSNPEITAAIEWLNTVPAEMYGEANVWLPYTRVAAQQWLQDFLTERLSQFGPYEDAIDTTHVRLWHSTLSPLMNIGLLTAQEVVGATLTYATTHDTPIASVEGFVRQVIGWREFIRASYEVDGVTMRTSNFFSHTRPLPTGSWDGIMGLLPFDSVTRQALTYGYTHHITRLMVAGNLFLLTGTHPDEVYRWFMGMYVDAYDWVMVPNVYGMSQFADGGLFATKPYISGAAYIKKMSNYPGGDWEETWTALYWNFIAEHTDFFQSNHRLRMMPTLLHKMSPEKRQRYVDLALVFLEEH